MPKLPSAAGLVASVLLGLVPAAALADTPFAVYQTTDRNMDFQLAHCGADDTQLCVTLLAARGSGDVPAARDLLGKPIVDHAVPSGDNVWTGSVTLFGFTGTGTLTLHPGKEFLIHGCVMQTLCTDQMLIPAR